MRSMNYVLFYDQAVDLHFPPHYRDVYLDRLPHEHDRMRGLFFCRDHGSEQVRQLKSAGHVVLGKERPWGAWGRWRYSRRFGKSFQQLIMQALEANDDPVTVIVHDDPWAAQVALDARQRHQDRIRVIYRIGNLKPEGLLRLSRHPLVHLMARLAGRWRDRMINRADAVIFMSDEMRRYLVEDRGVRPVRQAVIPSLVDCNAIETSLQSSREQDVMALSASLEEDRRWIVYAGDVSRGRNMPFLLEMMTHLRSLAPDVGLLILGNYPDPSYREQLLVQARSDCPDTSIHLVGPFSPDSYYQALQLADVAVNPFPPIGDHLTNSPVKCMDYQATGLPTIATRIPDHELVLGETGLGTICDYSATEFAKACVDWLGDRTIDRGRAKQWMSQHRDLQVAVETIRLLAESERDGFQ
ncbi:MAG: hypothetical protein CMJ29_06475 [Phycisphaerae bacterium]|nr:hypothetical protein [Phycisphaerae bacterium]